MICAMRLDIPRKEEVSKAFKDFAKKNGCCIPLCNGFEQGSHLRQELEAFSTELGAFSAETSPRPIAPGQTAGKSIEGNVTGCRVQQKETDIGARTLLGTKGIAGNGAIVRY